MIDLGLSLSIVFDIGLRIPLVDAEVGKVDKLVL